MSPCQKYVAMSVEIRESRTNLQVFSLRRLIFFSFVETFKDFLNNELFFGCENLFVSSSNVNTRILKTHIKKCRQAGIFRCEFLKFQSYQNTGLTKSLGQVLFLFWRIVLPLCQSKAFYKFGFFDGICGDYQKKQNLQHV